MALLGVDAMVVQNTEAKSLAQTTQIPPAIRTFAQSDMLGVTEIRRFRVDETTSRGWGVKARSVNLRNVPDGFTVSRVGRTSDKNVCMMTIRDE